MIKKQTGFTIIEVLVSLTLISFLFGFIYNFMSRSFKYSQVETKNIDAVQDMVVIVNNIRNDLRCLYEDPYDKSTFSKYDPASKTFEFYIISGITENNMKILSRVTYRYENKLFLRIVEILKNDGSGKKESLKLADATKVSNFKIKIFDLNGNEIFGQRKQGQYPACFNINVEHADNKRLNMNINVYVPHIKECYNKLELCRVEDWKIKSIDTQFLTTKFNIGNIAATLNSFDFVKIAKYDKTRTGINMGTPQYLQKTVTKLHKSFGGVIIGQSNPYEPPPPPPPSSSGSSYSGSYFSLGGK